MLFKVYSGWVKVRTQASNAHAYTYMRNEGGDPFANVIGDSESIDHSHRRPRDLQTRTAAKAAAA